jgi:hypothetical protein
VQHEFVRASGAVPWHKGISVRLDHCGKFRAHGQRRWVSVVKSYLFDDFVSPSHHVSCVCRRVPRLFETDTGRALRHFPAHDKASIPTRSCSAVKPGRAWQAVTAVGFVTNPSSTGLPTDPPSPVPVFEHAPIACRTRLRDVTRHVAARPLDLAGLGLAAEGFSEEELDLMGAAAPAPGHGSGYMPA